MCYSIIASHIEHLPTLPDIELAAAQLFSVEDLPEPFRSSPTDQASFLKAHKSGLLWVAVDENKSPVGFVLCERLSKSLHIKEMDVHPNHARRGIGQKLLEHLALVGTQQGTQILTLTTFRHIPWNAHFYERMGFHTIAPSNLGEELDEILSKEAALGLRNRIAMRKVLA
jgi:ribosomal protein S18 acetylase RimI-like enzyme